MQLARWTLIPASGYLGEPVEAALSPGSLFLEILAGRRPHSTTVTIWTYPDSFAEFRRIKAELFTRGFATAGRPLPDSVPISGSPHGSRSAAQ